MARKVLTNLDLNNNQILNALLQLLGSDPGSPAEAQIWYDSTNHVLKFRSNAATIILGRLDQITAPTAAVAMNAQKITGLADGTAATDAVTKQQLDAASAGLDPKGSVRVASTANVTIAGPGTTIDGVTLATGDRVLLKNQTTTAENGIYIFNGSAAAMTRATDADTSAEVTAGMYVFVEEGTANDNTGWVLTTNNPITLGTTGLAFTKFTGAASGVSKFTATIGDGSTTAITVTHSLGTQDVVVQCRDASTNAVVEPDIVQTSTTQTTLTFATAPATNSIKVVILG